MMRVYCLDLLYISGVYGERKEAHAHRHSTLRKHATKTGEVDSRGHGGVDPRNDDLLLIASHVRVQQGSALYEDPPEMSQAEVGNCDMHHNHIREASHAGSWYTNNGAQLSAELSGYINSATNALQEADLSKTKAIISPHAGYSYSGPTAGFGYKALAAAASTRSIDTVFVLGPSHHVYLNTVALPHPDLITFAAPNGDLEYHKEIIKELRETNQFQCLNPKPDEDEHSIELQIPFVSEVFKDKTKPKIVPLVVGNLSPEKEEEYAGILKKYYDKENVFFVISSDFCHWGQRFGYTKTAQSFGFEQKNLPTHLQTFHNTSYGETSKAIEVMDKTAVAILESKDHTKWTEYMDETENTICGRHPIGILLNLLSPTTAVKAMHYDQSGDATRDGSSVSYTSAIAVLS